MHPEVRQAGPGRCPKCGMDLVQEGAKIVAPKRKLKDFAPLIIIFGIILLHTWFAVWHTGTFDWLYAMRMFEGGFFIVFGLFKLLNWKGFVDAYSTYDLIAKRSRTYGYAYPLIELALGAGYLLNYHVQTVAWITLVLMTVGAIGVWGELRKKNQIPCACLGVVFKLPMTWVTFIEDMLMATMALIMIVIG
jgi:hypothetical protein